jgi:hypothetical protein
MADVISEEVAEQEFDRFVELMDLDLECEDEEDAKALAKQKSIIIKAIKNGSLCVNDNGEPIFTPRRTDTPAITFHEATGASLMAMDRKKKGENVGKLYATMADISKTPAKVYANMKKSDLNVCIAVTTLFLG